MPRWLLGLGRACVRLWRGGRDVAVPTRLQFQTTECGVAALAMILAHHGRHVSMEEIRRVTGVSRDCMSGADMARAARHFGLECKAYRREPEALRHMPLPMVVHVRFIHFMVLEGFTDTHVLFNDPHAGRIAQPVERFHEAFTGIAFTFSPGPAFRRGGRPLRPLRSLWRRMPPASRLLAGVTLLAGVLRAAPAILFAAAFGALLDALATAPETGFSAAAPLFGLMAAAIGLQAMLAATQSEAASRLQHALCRSESETLARHMLSLPYSFFAYRLPGRLHATLYAGDLVARHVGALLPAIARPWGAALLLPAIAFYDAAAAGTLLALGVICCAAFAVLARWRSGALRQQRAFADDEFASLAASLERIESVKLSRHDRDFVVGGAGANAGQLGAQQSFGVSERALHTAWRMFEFSALGAAMVLGVAALSAGRMTVGEASALVLLAGALALTLRELAGLRGRLDGLLHTLLWIEDVREHEPAPAGEAAVLHPRSVPAAAPACELQLRDVTFGYAAMKPPLVEGVSLEVRAGEQLGITGPSGGGKSTLVSLLTGLNRPWSGSRVQAEGHRVAWVDKTPFFFEGTVRGNLALWETRFGEADFAAAVHDACIAEVLEARPGGLDAIMEARGRNFSGGQQQRLEIARALLRQPTMLVLDEATDALDPALEARLRERLHRRGCTLVIVSHRASTLAACDRVIQVAGGRIVGTPLAQDAPPPEPSAPPVAAASEKGGHQAALVEAFRRVATALGEKVEVPEGLAQGEPEVFLESLAAHNGLCLRRVRFVVQDDWRRDHGPLIGFSRESGQPVAVLPHGNAYRIVHVSGARAAEDDLPSARTLRGEAFVLYPRAGLDDPRPSRLFASGLSRARTDLLRAVGLSALIAGAWALIPAAAALLLRDGGAAIPPSAPARAALALALAALALLLLECARSLALLRFEGRMEASLMITLYQRLARIRPSFTRGLPPEQLARGLVGVPRWLGHVRGPSLRMALDAAMAGACVLLLATLDRGLGWGALALLLPALAAPPLLALMGGGLEHRYYRERVIARRLLFDTLWGFARLRLLCRAEAAVDPAWTGDRSLTAGRSWLEGRMTWSMTE